MVFGELEKSAKNPGDYLIFTGLSGVADESDQAFWNENRNNERRLVAQGDDRTSYSGFGEIIDINPTVVDFGPIKIGIGEISNDIRVKGSFVYKMIGRLDVGIEGLAD